MADSTDITRWLLDAEDAVGKDATAQIQWLRDQRKAYSASTRQGDWAVAGTSFEGGSANAMRGISDKTNHDAIVGALRKLGDTELGSRGTLLSVQLKNIHS